MSALSLTHTTIGKKVVVAITGAALFGFVVAHLLGNLLLFAGPEAMNAYAATLASQPALLWTARIFLLVAVVAHIGLTLQLAGRNAGARPRRYQHERKDRVTSPAAKTMAYSGPLLFAFIVFHLAHLTAGTTLGLYEHSSTDVYGNVVNSFRIWWISAIYIFANIMLGLHLFHGGWSLTQTFGLAHPKYDPLRKRLATGLAVFVAGGNCFIPIAVLLGLVGSGV